MELHSVRSWERSFFPCLKEDSYSLDLLAFLLTKMVGNLKSIKCNCGSWIRRFAGVGLFDLVQYLLPFSLLRKSFLLFFETLSLDFSEFLGSLFREFSSSFLMFETDLFETFCSCGYLVWRETRLDRGREGKRRRRRIGGWACFD